MKKHARFIFLGLIGISLISGIAVFCGKNNSNPENPENNPEGNPGDDNGNKNKATLKVQTQYSFLDFKLPDSTQYLTIQNTSDNPAFNVKADLGETLNNAGVTQTPEPDCAKLESQKTCRIAIFVNKKFFDYTYFKVSGDNTNDVTAVIYFEKGSFTGVWQSPKTRISVGKLECVPQLRICTAKVSAPNFSGDAIQRGENILDTGIGEIVYNNQTDTVSYRDEIFLRILSPPPGLLAPRKNEQYFDQNFIKIEGAGHTSALRIKNMGSYFSLEAGQYFNGKLLTNCTSWSKYHFDFNVDPTDANKIIAESLPGTETEQIYKFKAVYDKINSTLLIVEAEKYVACAVAGAVYTVE